MNNEGYLCISVHFLLGCYHGRIERDRVAEWPPSPLRLFQTLVASAYRGLGESALPDAQEAALRWLEKKCECDPPVIVASEHRTAEPYAISVPNNDMDVWAKPVAAGKQPDKSLPDLRSMKTIRPTSLFIGSDDGNVVVHFLWPVVDNSERIHCDIFSGLVRRIIAFGWGTDLVAVCARVLSDLEACRLSGVTWRPFDRSLDRRAYRPLPTRGTLDALRARHARFSSRLDVAEKEYNHVQPYIELDEADAPRRVLAYIAGRMIAPRPFAEFELPEGVAFRQESTNEVAAMLRSLACELAKRGTHNFPGGTGVYVAGHVESVKRTPPRFSYIPLPTIGHQHADGMIRRVMIAEPHGGDGSHARWAQSCLRNISLTDIKGNERGVLLDLWRTSSRGIVERYVNESRIWTSVTPMVLPGFDDGDYSKAQKLCLDALRQAELPVEAVEELTLRKAPYWLGSLHPVQYRRPQYLKQLPAWHLRLVFREAVPGPLAVGAGRHCGLGVLAASEERQQ